MFLDDSEVHVRPPYGSPRGLNAYSRRKSRSDISSDYEHDRLGLVRTKSDYARSEFERPMGLMRTASDFDDYDRPPLMGHNEFDWDEDRSSSSLDYEREREANKYRVEYIGDVHNAKVRRKKSFKRSRSWQSCVLEMKPNFAW